jgi:hypothetical protein
LFAEKEKENMKRLIRLAVIGTIGAAVLIFAARNSLSAALHALNLTDTSKVHGSGTNSETSYESILFTDWLAGDVLCVSTLPVWGNSEGQTADTMRAYAALHDARKDSESLTDAHKRALQHQEAKDEALRRFVDHEIHLTEAANIWHELDRDFGQQKTEIIARLYPGKTDTERYCHRLVRELELSTSHRAERFGPALERARAEVRLLNSPGNNLIAD